MTAEEVAQLAAMAGAHLSDALRVPWPDLRRRVRDIEGPAGDLAVVAEVLKAHDEQSEDPDHKARLLESAEKLVRRAYARALQFGARPPDVP